MGGFLPSELPVPQVSHSGELLRPEQLPGASELLKPRERGSTGISRAHPEEESEPEAMVGSGQLGGQGEAVPQFSPAPPLIQMVGLGLKDT